MAAGDLTDLATAKIAASIDTSSSTTDGILGAIITAISAYVPQVLNRNILADNYFETYEGNGKDRMLLRQRPVIQISSIGWTGQAIAIQSDPLAGPNGLWTDGRSALLVGYSFPRGETIRIAYSAGYITVPPDISLAVAELVAEAYARRGHVGELSRAQGPANSTSYDARSMHAAIADKLSYYRHGAPC